MKKYTLRIVPNNDVIGDLYKNHSYYNEGDSGIDLFLPNETFIPMNETRKLSFGISCEVICYDDDKEYNVSYLLLPRSSIVKTPLRFSNSIGLIDAYYRGNLCAYVDNIKKSDYLVLENTRLFQLVTPDLTPFNKIIVSSEFTNNKNRGGGHGSTGL